ncbi:unnamed protein product, partial [Rotaria socialis]
PGASAPAKDLCIRLATPQSMLTCSVSVRNYFWPNSEWFAATDTGFWLVISRFMGIGST